MQKFKQFLKAKNCLFIESGVSRDECNEEVRNVVDDVGVLIYRSYHEGF